MFSDYNLCRTKLLKKEEVIKLAYAVQDGDYEAREKLIIHNVRLVASIAKYFNRRYKIPIGDLISYGCMGLIGAVENYRPWDHDWVAFSTYATFWIRRSMANGVVDERFIRMPKSCEQDLIKWNDAINKIMSTGERFTIEDVIRESGLSEIRAENVRLAIAVASSKQDKYDALDHVVPGDEPVIELDSKSSEVIARMLDKLHPREARILRGRMGIGCEEMSLAELGKEFDITKERVRQIELKAKKNLLKLFKREGIGFDDMFKAQNETSEL